MGDSFPKYFFAVDSVMTIEFGVGKGFFGFPSSSGKSKMVKKDPSTILMLSLNDASSLFTSVLRAYTRQVDSTSGKFDSSAFPSGRGVAVLMYSCSGLYFSCSHAR